MIFMVKWLLLFLHSLVLSTSLTKEKAAVHSNTIAQDKTSEYKRLMTKG